MCHRKHGERCTGLPRTRFYSRIVGPFLLGFYAQRKYSVYTHCVEHTHTNKLCKSLFSNSGTCPRLPFAGLVAALRSSHRARRAPTIAASAAPPLASRSGGEWEQPVGQPHRRLEQGAQPPHDLRENGLGLGLGLVTLTKARSRRTT